MASGQEITQSDVTGSVHSEMTGAGWKGAVLKL